MGRLSCAILLSFLAVLCTAYVDPDFHNFGPFPPSDDSFHPSASSSPQSENFPSPSVSSAPPSEILSPPSESPHPSATPSSSSVSSAPANSDTSTDACGETEWAAAKSALLADLRGQQDVSLWPARLLFTGFHDCLPFACDASIQHEQDRIENSKVFNTLAKLNHVRAGTCVTLSDMIKIGLEVAMELSGGPHVSCPKGNHPDASSANPAGQLPSPVDSISTIVRKFRSRGGITTEEAVAANFGGHSYGGLGVNPHTGIPTIFFTSNPSKLDEEYCTKLLSPSVNVNQVLPSDLEYVRSLETRAIVENFNSNPTLLRNSFGSFMAKLCRL